MQFRSAQRLFNMDLFLPFWQSGLCSGIIHACTCPKAAAWHAHRQSLVLFPTSEDRISTSGTSSGSIRYPLHTLELRLCPWTARYVRNNGHQADPISPPTDPISHRLQSCLCHPLDRCSRSRDTPHSARRLRECRWRCGRIC